MNAKGGLLNYTTTVDSLRSIGEIQACLVRHGANEISIAYESGKPAAIAFVMVIKGVRLRYRLPARTDAVRQTLELQHRRGKIQPRFATPEQADRVAWRIMKDWVEAQMAIVESGLVTLDEVMLPYELDARDRTMYQFISERRALPAPEHLAGEQGEIGGAE